MHLNYAIGFPFTSSALDTCSTSVLIETEQLITYLQIIIFLLIDVFRIMILSTEKL